MRGGPRRAREHAGWAGGPRGADEHERCAGGGLRQDRERGRLTGASSQGPEHGRCADRLRQTQDRGRRAGGLRTAHESGQGTDGPRQAPERGRLSGGPMLPTEARTGDPAGHAPHPVAREACHRAVDPSSPSVQRAAPHPQEWGRWRVPRLGGAVMLALASRPAAAGPVATPLLATPSLARALTALALVIGLLLLCAWAARRWRLGARWQAGVPARVVGSLSLGPRERIVILEVDATWLVVGVTPGGMRTLHTLPAHATADAAASPAPPRHPAREDAPPRTGWQDTLARALAAGASRRAAVDHTRQHHDVPRRAPDHARAKRDEHAIAPDHPAEPPDGMPQGQGSAGTPHAAPPTRVDRASAAHDQLPTDAHRPRVLHDTTASADEGRPRATTDTGRVQAADRAGASR